MNTKVDLEKVRSHFHVSSESFDQKMSEHEVVQVQLTIHRPTDTGRVSRELIVETTLKEAEKVYDFLFPYTFNPPTED